MIISRRRFLAAGAASTAVVLGGCRAVPASGAGEYPLGLQLFTLRDLFARDPHATLQKVAAIGYREVEFGGGGYEGMDHAALRRTLDGEGLRAPSVHVGYELLRDRFDQSVTMAKTLGAQTVVLPYMSRAFHEEAAWTEAVTNFNRFAEQLARVGLGFAYHNHDFEFTVKPGGISLWDRFLRARATDLVRFELDLYWIARAGGDVEAVIRSLPGQVHAYHVKDMAADGSMAAVGTGTIDFAAIFRLNRLAGVQHFYVENDMARDPWLPDVTTSFNHLRRLLAANAH